MQERKFNGHFLSLIKFIYFCQLIFFLTLGIIPQVLLKSLEVTLSPKLPTKKKTI